MLLAALASTVAASTDSPSQPSRTPFDGTWTAVGGGIGGSYVNDLVVYHDELIACGYFNSAGGAPAANIAAWDGTAWSPLGGGVNGDVASMTVWNDQLIVVGNFTSAGGTPVSYDAAWDGSTWAQLSTSNQIVATRVCPYNGSL